MCSAALKIHVNDIFWHFNQFMWPSVCEPLCPGYKAYNGYTPTTRDTFGVITHEFMCEITRADTLGVCAVALFGKISRHPAYWSYMFFLWSGSILYVKQQQRWPKNFSGWYFVIWKLVPSLTTRVHTCFAKVGSSQMF